VKSGRKQDDPEAYARLLTDLVGFSDRSLYEAMFTISQHSTLMAAWRIDPSVSRLVYGQAVERLGGSLQELYERFRGITRNTRDYHVVLGSERNGRSEGRLDQIIHRLSELEAQLAASRRRAMELEQMRARLRDCEAECDRAHAERDATEKSLDHWRAWQELETRLRPAVASYDRLRQLNERCQQLARALAEVRQRLARDFAVFDKAPPDLVERLEYYPLVLESAEQARQRYDQARQLRDWLNGELRAWQERLAGEFADVRNRPELADRVERLRTVREEIAQEQLKIAQSDGQGTPGVAAAPAVEAESIRRQISLREAWRSLGPDWEKALAEAGQLAGKWKTGHAAYVAAQRAIESLDQRLAGQDCLRVEQESLRQEAIRQRDRERFQITAAIQSARSNAERARSRQNALEASRRDLERRFVDFLGAPGHLLELWDRWHEIERQQMELRRQLDRARDDQQQMERRTYWRRGLTVIGAIVLWAHLIWARSLSDWLGALIAAGLTGSLRWIFRTEPGEMNTNRQARQQLEAKLGQLARQRDQLLAELGPQFVVPPEREAEWRRLWPTYRRELDRLQAQMQTLPDEQSIAAWIQEATEAEQGLVQFDRATEELLLNSARLLEQAQQERAQRASELESWRAQALAVCRACFGTDREPDANTALSLLPTNWEPLLRVARADSPSIATVAQWLEWCHAVQDGRWSSFAAECRELDRLESRLAELMQPAPPVRDPLEDHREMLKLLQEQEQQLVSGISPYSADTDPGWLRERLHACKILESQIAERELELETLPDPAGLRLEWERAESERSEAWRVLGPFLEQFGHPQGVLDALAERLQLTEQVHALQLQASGMLNGSGFASLEELAHEAGKAEGLVATVRASAQELLHQANELWQAVDAPPELAAQRVAELEAQLAERRTTFDSAQRERAELCAVLRQLDSEATADPSETEAELAALRNEQAQLEAERDRIAAEFQEASRFMQELERVERTALQGRITAYFAEFSRTPGRHVALDEQLGIELRHDDGTRYHPNQLSHGARDQLYLAVYLASAAGFDLPFVLDDPFVNCDGERLAAIRACWDRLAPDHQLILLSHDPQLAAWAPPLEMRAAA
jgi:uncharacterized protein YhaN